MNAIDINYRMCGKTVKKEKTRNSQAEETVSFLDIAAEKRESAVDRYKRNHPQDALRVDAQVRAGKSVIKKNGMENVSREDMSIEEYKVFIDGLLNSIPFDSTRIYDREITSITDAGWEQMKNDAEYEAWVLGYTVENRSVRNPFFGWQGASGNFYVEKFGASIEEHVGQSIGKPSLNISCNNERNKKSWWKKRREKMKERMDEQAEKAMKKAHERSVLEQRHYLNSRLASEKRLENFLSNGTQNSDDVMHYQSEAMNALAAMSYNNLSIFSKRVKGSSKSES